MKTLLHEFQMSVPNLKLILIGLALVTIILSTSTVRYLASIIAEDNHSLRHRSLSTQPGREKSWQRVIDQAETNFQGHLPHLLPHRGVVVAQTPLATPLAVRPLLENAAQEVKSQFIECEHTTFVFVSCMWLFSAYPCWKPVFHCCPQCLLRRQQYRCLLRSLTQMIIISAGLCPM